MGRWRVLERLPGRCSGVIWRGKKYSSEGRVWDIGMVVMDQNEMKAVWLVQIYPRNG